MCAEFLVQILEFFTKFKKQCMILHVKFQASVHVEQMIYLQHCYRKSEG